ncbi:hypothetical protein [Spiroplasma clarkii]|uniref:hypothetical protein n=1 Tax=Spiroplasma clarkii TaxID=2139 RepID=UPI001649F493|nr:hypothetical protein [Spiroplasma clarkii]
MTFLLLLVLGTITGVAYYLILEAAGKIQLNKKYYFVIVSTCSIAMFAFLLLAWIVFCDLLYFVYNGGTLKDENLAREINKIDFIGIYNQVLKVDYPEQKLEFEKFHVDTEFVKVNENQIFQANVYKLRYAEAEFQCQISLAKVDNSFKESLRIFIFKMIYVWAVIAAATIFVDANAKRPNPKVIKTKSFRRNLYKLKLIKNGEIEQPMETKHALHLNNFCFGDYFNYPQTMNRIINAMKRNIAGIIEVLTAK